MSEADILSWKGNIFIQNQHIYLESQYNYVKR
jgi:hypothetical protein